MFCNPRVADLLNVALQWQAGCRIATICRQARDLHVGCACCMANITNSTAVVLLIPCYCSLQISRWTETSPHEFKLLVPPRQIEVGKLLVRCIYEQAPDLSSCSQQQLPQLLQLADKYDVQAAIVLAGRQLANIPSADLEWDTVQAVYSLPPACPDMEPFKALFTAAADRLQQEFGDLDMVWAKASANRIPKLLSLPFTGFKQLLSNESTRVVNENVVADTIGHWYCEQRKQQQLQQRQPQSKQQPQQTTQHHHLGNQQQQISETLKQQLQELMRLVRIQDCTQVGSPKGLYALC